MKNIILMLPILILIINILYAENITILAASSLKYSLEDIKKEFLKNKNNDEININYISSGKAYYQIVNGLPAHMFISADTNYPNKLFNNKKTSHKPINYARGKLVIFSMNNIPLESILDLKNIKIRNISLPNPKLAPYGLAGIESIKYYKLYDEIKNKIVLGESIGQAAQYVKTGVSEVGFNALSMVIKDKNIKYIELDSKSYNPILQAMVITEYGKHSTLAKEFQDFILSNKAQEILKSYGYDKP